MLYAQIMMPLRRIARIIDFFFSVEKCRVIKNIVRFDAKDTPKHRLLYLFIDTNWFMSNMNEKNTIIGLRVVL